jgi:hypothetical protein
MTNIRKIKILLKEAEYYQVFMYQRGSFYDQMMKTDVPYNFVEKGKQVDLFVNIQVAKSIPIEGIFKYTISDDIGDCIDDPAYDLDKDVTRKSHQQLNQTYGCTFPYWGGIYQNMTYDMCTDTSLYSMYSFLRVILG